VPSHGPTLIRLQSASRGTRKELSLNSVLDLQDIIQDLERTVSSNTSRIPNEQGKFNNMPHFTTPENISTLDQEPEAMAVDARNEMADHETTQSREDPAASESNGNSQEINVPDNDITMADVGVEGDEVPQIKDEMESEFKLEDLFADIDSDEEFPSSTNQDIKVAPSSPDEPVSSL